jgi:trimethylamine--corrinoid protein Co-methyltransferase
MPKIQLQFFSDRQVRDVHEASLAILRDTGVKAHHDEVLSLMHQAGAKADAGSQIARLPERLVMDCIAQARKQYVLYGRDKKRMVHLGYGDFVLMSSPGQFAWLDSGTTQLRPATTQDLHDAIRLGDTLENINIVGAMAQPQEVSEKYRDVFLTAELVKNTAKPTRCWVKNGQTARHIIEIYRTVAGSDAALRAQPMVEAFLEPISPLQLPRDGLDIVKEFARAGQPVSIGPMAMTSATAPATLAGTLAQENAEILAGTVATQLLAPGTPITYGGIPHIMDPRTGVCSFGSPEQALMAVAMVQMARFYGFPVYINVGLTDAKLPDAQAGIEKATSMLLGALAGADTFGHCGICGTDHAASLVWLALDNELANYVKRIMQGFDISADTLATDVINDIGPAGNFLAESHTIEHFRRELWLPSSVWTRQPFDIWTHDGCKSLSDRLIEKVNDMLATHKPEPIDESLAKEIDRMVEYAKQELV